VFRRRRQRQRDGGRDTTTAFRLFTAAEGAGGHCEEGVRNRFHEVAFDWLDETVG
jgi:hypothetical protein